MKQPLRTFISYMICSLLLSQGCRANVTGAYASQQATWIAYLHLTQTGSKITGYMLTVSADSVTATRSKRSDVHGSVSGGAITLKYR